MNNRFQFYEVVVVVDVGDASLESVIGEEGMIIGMAEDEKSQSWGYSVLMQATGVVWNFNERQLESTGKQKTRCDVYSGDSVNVEVDPITGKGYLK